MSDAVPPPVTAIAPARGPVLEAAKALLVTVGTFVVVGPVVGYFALMLPVGATTIGGVEGVFRGLLGVFALMPIGIPVAYMIAYVPAGLTGLGVAVLDLFVDLGAYRIAAAILLGAGITLALLNEVSAQDIETGLPGGISSFGALAAATGGIAAAVCALLAPRRPASGLWGRRLALTAPANTATNKP
jgi:hypothetical protein